MKLTVTIRKALTDKKLLGNVLAGESWRAWRTLMIAMMGEALTDAERTRGRVGAILGLAAI